MFGTECEGVPSFDRIRHRDHDDCVFLYAFDLIELNGDDLRRDPLVVRKATLTSVLAKAAPSASGSTSIWNSMTVRPCSTTPAGWGWKASCRSGRNSAYRSGRSPDWLKMKNPACEAVRREAEEDWGR